MKKNIIEIRFNDTNYISIGSYMDNNDGIIHYWPENEERWQDFFSIQEPIIILWTISYLESESFEEDETLHKLHNIIKQDVLIKSFLKKYCWKSELESMFVDFVFGEYSAHGNKELPIIFVDNKKIDQEYFEFDTHIFIKKVLHSEFVENMEKICANIVSEIKNSI